MPKFCFKKIVPAACFVLILLFNLSVCRAEMIYLTSGETRNAKVLYRNRDTIWLEHSLGFMGLERQKITKIVNDDGSISQYDYESLTTGLEDFIKQKEYNKAIGLCNRLLETFPDANQIHRLRGNLTQKVEDFNTAIADYNFLIQNLAADAKIFNNLGSIYARKKEYAKAVDLSEKRLPKTLI